MVIFHWDSFWLYSNYDDHNKSSDKMVEQGLESKSLQFDQGGSQQQRTGIIMPNSPAFEIEWLL
jgi:hypothetical protein